MAAKTGNVEKRRKRTEKMAASERLTNGFMLCLTYGLGAIVLLEIVRRHYLMWDMNAWNFASKFCITFCVLFAIGAAIMALFGCIKKISAGRSRNYTIFFVISSLISLFLAYDIRLPISQKLYETNNNWGAIDFLKNLDLARDAQYVEYGIIVFLVIALIVYAIRLARLEKKK